MKRNLLSPDQKKWYHDSQVIEWRRKFNQANGDDIQWKKIFSLYLKSDVWKDIRNRKIKNLKNTCEQCKRYFLDSYLDVHHKTYDRVGGKERDEDLVLVCGECHQLKDEEREQRNFEKSEITYNRTKYNNWLINWANKIYHEDWDLNDIPEEIIEKFHIYRYEKWCINNNIEFNENFDEVPEEYIEAIKNDREENYFE